MRTLVFLTSTVFVQCGPQFPSDDEPDWNSTGAVESSGDWGGSGTEGGEPGTEGSGSASDTELPNPSTGWVGEETDTGDTLEPLACPGARWLAITSQQGDPVALSVDSQGHVLLLDRADEGWPLTELDAAGAVVSATSIGGPSEYVAWGGVDATAHRYTAFYDYGPQKARGVRKVDAAGALVWERDLGPVPNGEFSGLSLAVAPNGATVVTERWWNGGDDTTRLVKHDAAGAQIWDEQVDPLLKGVLAINDQGAMAAVSYNNGGGEVRGLAPDATTLWTHNRWILDAHWAAIDPAGSVVLGAPGTLGERKVARYAADGAVLWDLDLTPGIHSGSFDDFEVNASGEMAISVAEDVWGEVYAAKFDAAGALVAKYACSPSFTATKVAIDDAGAVYLAGTTYLDGSSLQFVAAFD